MNKCEHGRKKNICRDCGGASICSHDRRRNRCRDCGGSSICSHGRQKNRCRDCGGASICSHGRRRSDCRDCGGSSICNHGRRRNFCKDCRGASICNHGRIRSQCVECKGASICNHGRRRSDCVQCGGSRTCKYHNITFCGHLGSRKYQGYCVGCFAFLNPDKPISKNYRTKERCVADFLGNAFPDYDIVFNKTITGGCSKKRPDVRFDFGNMVIIIEIDENRHEGYNCENKRIMTIMQDIGMRPLIVIRFNPDSYKNKSKNVSSCWGFDKNGKCRVKPTKVQEWNERLITLQRTVENMITVPPKKELTLVHLFY
jgi:hypothetical protein